MMPMAAAAVSERKHEQASDTIADVHPMTVETFIEQQQRQSLKWLEHYADQLKTKVAFESKFVFGRTVPIRDAATRDDTALAILNKYGQ